jgi:hypothetical protein
MRRAVITATIAVVFLVGSVGWGQLTFQYEKTIGKTVRPYALAVNSSGGLFFVTFNAAQSKLVYIADPIHADDTFTTISHASFTGFPTQRGLQGVTVDASDNVYVSGDTGTDSVFKKFNPPSFSEDATFNPNMTGARILGCDMFGPYVAAVTFPSVRCYDSVDGSYDKYIYFDDNLQTYGRDVGVNPANYDIFVSRNGASRKGSVVYYSGGNPSSTNSNLDYVRISATFIDNLMQADTYGDGTQGIGFYAARNLLMVNNRGIEAVDDQVGTLDVYLISGTGGSATATLETQISGSESGRQLGEAVDGVMFQYPDTERLFVSDYANNRILVYTYGSATTPTPFGYAAAREWTLYE